MVGTPPSNTEPTGGHRRYASVTSPSLSKVLYFRRERGEGLSLRQRNAREGPKMRDDAQTKDAGNTARPEGGTATFRIFGSLRTECAARGIPAIVELPLPPEGATAKSIAESMDIPLRMVEGVFVNHKVHGINHVVMPGDRAAFVPYDVPGPHRVSLGIRDAGLNPDR